MGHVAAQCKGKKRCAKCGGAHDYGECGSNVMAKCCNCGGEHSAAFGGCKVQREAQRYIMTDPVSYAEAIKQIGRTTVRTDGAYTDVPVVGLLSGLVLLIVLA